MFRISTVFVDIGPDFLPTQALQNNNMLGLRRLVLTISGLLQDLSQPTPRFRLCNV